jgi:hypothetical protein
MNKKILKTSILFWIFVFVFSAVPLSQAQTQDHSVTFQLKKNPEDLQKFYLTLTVPSWLIDYYNQQNHNLNSGSDYPKFVTPATLKPVADCLRQIYSNDEDFANGVLEITHQITYRASSDPQYPVETLADGIGDCDLFAQIAASILQAGAINTVLLLYQFPQNSSKNHMQVAVQLNDAPTKAHGAIYSVTYGGFKYYIGECTGSGWRVGDCSSDYVNAPSEVVSLENSEKTAVGTVYASLEAQQLSTLALTFSEKTVFTDSKIVITGQVNPELANQNVTLLAKASDSNWFIIGTALTSSDGRFGYTWNPQNMGLYYFMASWSGNRQFSGSASTKENIVVLPDITYLTMGIIAIAASVIAIFFLFLNFGGEGKKEKTVTFYPPPGAP